MLPIHISGCNKDFVIKVASDSETSPCALLFRLCALLFRLHDINGSYTCYTMRIRTTQVRQARFSSELVHSATHSVCFVLHTRTHLSTAIRQILSYYMQEHIQQRCPLLQTARTNVWPTAVQLHTKLYGSKEELEKTATFILQTGLSVQR